MRFDVATGEPFTLGVTGPDIHGDGVGGSELALVSWAEAMVQAGHSVRVFTAPELPVTHRGVDYLPPEQFDPLERPDALVVFRTPSDSVIASRAAFRSHWMHDGYPCPEHSRGFWSHVDAVVVSSQHHLAFHIEHSGLRCEQAVVLDLGVRVEEYQTTRLRTERDSFIYCSVPHRGLEHLAKLWPDVVERLPRATLTVTSDYSLWRLPRGDAEHRARLSPLQNVRYLGKVPRRELVALQSTAAVQLYPCTFDEMFCISAAECQVAGAVPVTSDRAALATTNSHGMLVAGDPCSPQWRSNFVQAACVAAGWCDDARKGMMRSARKRFSWERIVSAWVQLVKSGA